MLLSALYMPPHPATNEKKEMQPKMGGFFSGAVENRLGHRFWIRQMEKQVSTRPCKRSDSGNFLSLGAISRKGIIVSIRIK